MNAPQVLMQDPTFHSLLQSFERMNNDRAAPGWLLHITERTMKARHLIVSFACNDPDNGSFAGRALFCHVEVPKGEYVEFDHDDWKDGAPFDFDDATITLDGQKYRFERRKGWYGNWCWDGFWVPREEAIRLLLAMHASQEWHCTAGTVKILDWLERKAPQPKPQPIDIYGEAASPTGDMN